MTAKKKKDQGGIQIGGNVNVTRGDFVAGNKIKVDKGGMYTGGDIQESNVVTGDHNQVGDVESTREALFADLIKKIDQRIDIPSEDKEDLKVNIEEIKAEANKGEQADETFLSRRLRNIERIAPDIGEVILATLANPAAGFAMIIKKVAERARKAAVK